MERASLLAQPDDNPALALTTYDTGGTPAGARAAAANAARDGARIVLGPLRSDCVSPVRAAMPENVPVLTFSNDPRRGGDGVFLLGVTPQQSVTATLRYARSRGVRRVGIISTGSNWSRGAVSAARAVAPAQGMRVFTVDDDGDVLAALREGGGGTLPDAILYADGPGLDAVAARLAPAGVQLLGTVQWSGQQITGNRDLEGTWLSVPDPAPFESFSAAYGSRYGERPGLLAGIAFDAVRMAQSLVLMDRVTRNGPASARVFSGVTGDLSFASDGTAQRAMAVMTIGEQGLSVIHRGGQS